MKKLILTMLMATSITSHGGVLTKKLLCDNTTTIVTALNSKYGEVPVFAGEGTEDDKGTNIVLMLNATSGTWTMLQIRNDVACFLATGENAAFTK